MAAPQEDSTGNGTANRTSELGAEIDFGTMAQFHDGKDAGTSMEEDTEGTSTKQTRDKAPFEGTRSPKKARFAEASPEPSLTAAGRPARARAGKA